MMLRLGLVFAAVIFTSGLAHAQQSAAPGQPRAIRPESDSGRNCIFAGLAFTTGSFFCVGRGLLLACNTEKGPFWKHETALSNLCTEPTLRVFIPPEVRSGPQ